MEKTMIIRGREVSSKDIEFIREMIKVHPFWGGTRLSKELVLLWSWRAANGQLKDMARRTFLLKLEKKGYLTDYLPIGILTLKFEGESLVPMFLIRLLPLPASSVAFFSSRSK